MLKKLIGKKLTKVDEKYFEDYILKRKTLEELEELINLDIFKKNPDLLSNAVLKCKVENINKVYKLYSLFNIQNFITPSHICLNYNEVMAKINYLIDNNLPLVYLYGNNKIKINQIIIARGNSLKEKTGYSTEEIIELYLDKKYDERVIEKVKDAINSIIEKNNKNKKITFDKKMVLNYIYGNDINQYSLEELENDALFMSEVIRLSKDKTVYEYAVHALKCNYIFVLKTIRTFSKDTEFIKNVADYYLDNAMNEDYLRRLEINIIMSSLVKDKNDIIKYGVSASSMYEDILVNCRAIYKEDKERGYINRNFGLGFIYVYDLCLKYPIILDFFAKKMINNIFYNSGKTIEEILHNNFKSKEELDNTGINQFIINYIYKYDDILSNYAAINKKLIEKIIKDIYLESKNWEYYSSATMERKISILWQEGEKIYDSYDYLTYPFSSYLDTILRDLEYDEIYKKYSNDTLYGTYFVEEASLTFKDKAYMKELEKLVIKLFSEYKIDDASSDYDEKVTCKIIKFPQNSDN